MKPGTAWIIGLLTLGYVAAQPNSGSQSCPADRVVEGVRCGRPRQSCPTSSTCTGSGVCCWDAETAVEAPCLDPLMDNSDNFVTCSRDSECRGSCYRCQDLSGVGLGLCCPNASRPGCADTAPNANLMATSSQSMSSVQQDQQWFSNEDPTRASSGMRAQSQSFPSQSFDTQSNGRPFQDQGNGQASWGTSSFDAQSARGAPPVANVRTFQDQAPRGTGRERSSGFTRTSGFMRTSGGGTFRSQRSCPGRLQLVGICQQSSCPSGSDCFPDGLNGGVCCAMPMGPGGPRTTDPRGGPRTTDPRRFMEQQFARRGFQGARGQRMFRGWQ